MVTFEPDGAVAGVALGTTVAEAARTAGVRVDLPCGGAGVCGGCAVRVEGEVAPPTRDEERILGASRLERGMRLACRARVLGPVAVGPLGTAAFEVRAVTAAEVEGYPVDPPGARGLDCSGRALGAAVDIGTTTLAGALVDLRNGDVLATVSADNPQTAFGADVLARVSRAVAGGAEELAGAAAGGIEALLERLVAEAGATPDDVCEMSLAGNTAMVHLLLGIDPSPLGAAPYEGAFLDPVLREAGSLRIPAFAAAEAYIAPAVSAFVGGDVVAGLVATRFDDGERIGLFADLGTNGEIVMRTPDGLVAASAAAGPAFEGGAIEQGMPATPGAVERARLEGGDLRVDTIGGAPPAGICGSGLVDLAAAALDAGTLDASGRLSQAGGLAGRVVEYGDQLAMRVAEGVVLTQRDVRALQLAKGAVRAALELLLDETGVDVAKVREVLLAGGFGRSIDPASLVRIGMIHPEWGGRVRAVGNTALAGASAALVSSRARERALSIARSVRTLDLASDTRFEQAFLAALEFPAA